ncbi:DMT family transporter [Aliibacillus thermotolerans]|uniref:DMT family transporter n=1 Tax=Aliibacillus thermotolerans TaxID=1834418 RepID=A0ABW0U7J1_9BACI|nr:multidrug efflux SMR transporter [Aliibacillus thermotolerans]MDA3129995.1 QacE family quaternary ammonium compound efflux SMR transporter [Aliibacillus thermotolerans]
MAWLYVLGAAIVEVFWVIGLKYSDSVLDWLGTMIAIIFSFYFIIKACETLPTGTVYAVFTGSGASVIVLLDFLVFGEEFAIGKFLLLVLIITGVVGIKITTDDKETAARRRQEDGGY